MSANLIECTGVEVRHDGETAVECIDLAVPRGRLTALIGPNAAGKSSVLRAIVGLDHPAGGSILVDGLPMGRATPEWLSHQGIVLVPQGGNVFADLSVEENLRLGAFRLGMSQARMTTLLDETLRRFPALAGRKEQIAGTLSGGQQQMLAVARALMARPRLLCLDEPSVGLAPEAYADLLRILRELVEAGVSVLLAEQAVHPTLEMSDVAHFMEDGRIASTRTTDGSERSMPSEPQPDVDPPTDAGDEAHPEKRGGMARRILSATRWASQRPAAIWLVASGTVALAHFLSGSSTFRAMLFLGLTLGVAVANVAGVRLYRPTYTVPWRLFTLSVALTTVGNVVIMGYVVRDAPISRPSVADAIYWISYGLAMAAVVCAHRRRSTGSDATTMIDASIITIGVATLYWTFLMHPQLASGRVALADTLSQMVFPVFDLLLLAAIVRLAIGSGRRSFALIALGLGFVAMLTSSGLSTLTGTAIVDVDELRHIQSGWVIAFVLFGAAALHPSMRMLAERVERPRMPTSGWRLTLLCAATLLAPATLLFQFLQGETSTGLVPVVVASGVLFLLVVHRMRGLVRTVTDHAKELAEARRHFTELVEGLDAIVLEADVHTLELTYAAGRGLARLGYTAEEWVGGSKRLMGDAHEDDHEVIAGAIRRVAEGRDAELECRIRTRDDDFVWFNARIHVHHDERARPVLLRVVMVDMTDRRRVEQERRAREAAEQANETKNRFLSRMSHELRTPLNAILGFAQLLEGDELSDPQRKRVGHIVGGGNHLLRLIDEVLDIARIEDDTLALTLEPVPLGELVQECVELMRPLAEERSVRLESDDFDGGLVLADPQRLKQVLLNLLSNGIKYNGPEGSVRVGTTAASHRTLLSVTDTGSGISHEAMGRLFTPFDRLGAEETGIEGTGLGLALCKRLVDAMDGELEIRSEEGRGTAVLVNLSSVETRGPDRRSPGTPLPGSAASPKANGDGSPDHRPLRSSTSRWDA